MVESGKATNMICVFENIGRTAFQERCNGALQGFSYLKNQNLSFAVLAKTSFVIGDVAQYGDQAAVRLATLLDTAEIDGIFATQFDVVPVILAAIEMLNTPRKVWGGGGKGSLLLSMTLEITPCWAGLRTVRSVSLRINSRSFKLLDFHNALNQPHVWAVGFLPTMYIFSLLTVNETTTGIIMATGPLLVNPSTISHELRVIANDSITVFPLDVPRTILIIFHQPEPFVDKEVTIGAIDDAAAQFRYNVSLITATDWYQEAEQIHELEALLAGCRESVDNAGCRSALITSNPSPGFVEAAATLAAAAGIPYVGKARTIRSDTIGMDRANLSLPVHLNIGNDNLITGYDAGSFLINRGAQFPLCLIPSKDEQYLLLCQGMANAFSITWTAVVEDPVVVDVFNTSQRVVSILQILQQNRFDSVLCTYPSLCTTLFAAVDSGTAGIYMPAQVASIGMDPTTVGFLTDGRIALAMETAPYAQGFMAMMHTGLFLESSTDTVNQTVRIGGTQRTWVCPPGFFYNNASTAMYARMPSRAMGLSSVCTACPPNTFAAEPNARKCMRCPAGTFANGTGAMWCQTCADGVGVDAVGAFVNVTGTELLPACAAAYHSQASPPVSRGFVKVVGGIAATLVVGSAGVMFALRHAPVVMEMTVDVAGFVPVGAMLVIASALLLQDVLTSATCTCAVWFSSLGLD
ncbi:hypothetical protein BDK51DRAFT_25819 [Blyttiomyces helicus]|uniref:Tyrosine-protein kinase ephrin type A/B receptor-like domain-containing protein n=1 Tax=Blyttiomyces helicus TaxID=388810 RepID=A0A4P9W5S1_9FUNG|nr:hypothetical protein BDK51DRAFT_25819 [Blyttiomyces helicus]|eukprot:RKO87614.1 hypothetical protein BDK51DRAFT_25819 [Blyttiomyces helicus]